MTREEAINMVQGARQYLTTGNPIWNAKKIDEAMSMAIEALQREEAEAKGYCHRIKPKHELISRADAIGCVDYWIDDVATDDAQARAVAIKNDLRYMPSADAEPKWNCTANFVAEQLERLKDMTDEERLKLLQTLFSSAEAVQGCSGEEEPGQWRTENGKPSKAEYSVYCSKCGSWSEYRTKYCGNCGSLMKEENDEQ